MYLEGVFMNTSEHIFTFTLNRVESLITNT